MLHLQESYLKKEKGYTEGSVNPFKRIKGSKKRVFPPLDAIVKIQIKL